MQGDVRVSFDYVISSKVNVLAQQYQDKAGGYRLRPWSPLSNASDNLEHDDERVIDSEKEKTTTSKCQMIDYLL